MKLFESQGAKERKSVIKNLIHVMMADGTIDEKELAFLRMVCSRVGISGKEVQYLINHPEKVDFKVPQSNEERVLHLIEVVLMMLVDGQIDAREMDVCMKTAVQLGFNPSVVPRLLHDMIEAAKRGATPNKIVRDLSVYFE